MTKGHIFIFIGEDDVDDAVFEIEKFDKIDNFR